MPKHPAVQAHAAELSRLFVGCINEVLANVGVADRLDPEGLPADLVAFVEKVRNDAMDEAAIAVMKHIGGGKVAFGTAHAIRSLKHTP